MTVWCFGSINIDHVYEMDHLPAAGETLAARSYRLELGGKGANQAVACARAGAALRLLGAVGTDGGAALQALGGHQVDCGGVQRIAGATGHAIILVDRAGENSIVIHAGANRALEPELVLAALAAAEIGDLLLMQNETSHQVEVAQAAMGLGLEVVYSAAPFDIEALRAVLPYVSILVMNAVEAAQMRAALGDELGEIPVETLVITRGAEGASWIARGTPEIHVPALPTQAVDTTGAGDCFTGALAAALDGGAEPEAAMRFATAAASLQVARPGAAAAMPDRDEIVTLLGESG